MYMCQKRENLRNKSLRRGNMSIIEASHDQYIVSRSHKYHRGNLSEHQGGKVRKK